VIGLAAVAAFGLGGSSGRRGGAPRPDATGIATPLSPSQAARASPASGGPRPAAPPPTGADGAVDRLLAHTSYVELAGRRRREVALTFDDGPGASTPAILAILKRTHTPATFFLIGRYARAYPQLVAKEAREGFDIGDHTETHPFLSRLSSAAQATEIDSAANDIRRAGAPAPRLFRPPYGSFDRSTLSLLHGRGMLMVLWSADTKDFSRPGARKISYAGISGGQPGAIVLMHDGGGDRSQTVAALPRIIRRLRQRGYALVTVSRLIADDPPSRHQPPPRQLSGHL
jgi:peptidoglycan/xylan/chitin deacetylase (PgdA/CDA1 family)